MIVEEGPTTSGDIEKSDRITWLIILSTSGTAKSGATSQAPSTGGSRVAALSDQFVGKVGPIVGEWSPERFARMTSEY